MVINISQILHYIFYVLYFWPFSYLSFYFMFDRFKVTPRLCIEVCTRQWAHSASLHHQTTKLPFPSVHFLRDAKCTRDGIPERLWQRLWSFPAHKQHKAGPHLCVLGTRQQLLIIHLHWSVFSLIAFLLFLFPHKENREKEKGSEEGGGRGGRKEVEGTWERGKERREGWRERERKIEGLSLRPLTYHTTSRPVDIRNGEGTLHYQKLKLPCLHCFCVCVQPHAKWAWYSLANCILLAQFYWLS